MSKENINQDNPDLDEPSVWHDDWVTAEHKLSPHDAHEMLRRTFAERLDEWRRNRPDENSWVIAFYYNHEDEDEFSHKGALWIPPTHVQDVINKAGAYIHMSAMIDMEDSLFGTGIKTNHQPPSGMDLSKDTPLVYVDSQFSMVLRQRDQIERDFGVIIQT